VFGYMSRCLWKLGRLEEAEKFALQERQLGGDSPFHNIKLLQVYWQQGRILEAIEGYKKIITKYRKFLLAKYYYITLLTILGKTKEALELADQLLCKNAKNVRVLNLKGYLYVIIGDEETARATFRAALEIDPDSAYTKRALAGLDSPQPVTPSVMSSEYDLSLLIIVASFKRKAANLIASGKVKSAIKMLEMVLEINPFDGVAMCDLAKLYLDIGENDKAEAVFPSDPYFQGLKEKMKAKPSLPARVKKPIKNRFRTVMLDQMPQLLMPKAEDLEGLDEAERPDHPLVLALLRAIGLDEDLVGQYEDRIKSIQVVFNRAESLRQSGRLKEALDLYAEVLSVDHKNQPALSGRDACINRLLELSDRMLAKGNLREAKRHLELALAAKPDDPVITARLVVVEGKVESSQAHRSSAKGLGLTLADLLTEAEDEVEVFAPQEKDISAAAEEVIDKKQGHDPLQYAQLAAQLTTAKNLLQRNQYRAARQIYQRILSVDPAFIQAWIAWGSASLKEKKTKEARRCFEKVLELSPDNMEAKRSLAHCCLMEGKTQEGIEKLKEILEVNPSESSSLSLIYNYYLERGEVDALGIYFESLLEKNRENVTLLRYLGSLYLLFGETEKAAQAFKACTQLNPKDLANFNFLGRAYRETGDYAKSLAAFDAAIEKTVGKLTKVGSMVGKGHTLLRMQEYERARTIFKQVLKIKPEHTSALYGMAKYYYFVENYKNGLAEINKVFRSATPGASHINIKGDLLRKLGRIKEAIREFERALALIEGTKLLPAYYLMEQMNAYNSLGFCAILIGDKQIQEGRESEAFEEYTNALKRFEQSAAVEASASGRRKSRTYYGMGFACLALFKLKNEKQYLDLALEKFGEALNIQPNNDHALQGQAEALALL